MTKFTTLVPHIGDRPHDPYQVGETREVDDENSVRHLIDGGTLGEFDETAEAAFLKGKEKPAAPAEASAEPAKTPAAKPTTAA